MAAFRSVVLTLQLLVLLVGLMLPLVSHQWMSARIWRTDAVMAIRIARTPGVDADSAHPHTMNDALRQVNTSSQPETTPGFISVWLVTDTELWSHLLLLGVQLLLLFGLSRSELYRPRTSVCTLVSSLTSTIDLPPPDVPPRLAYA